MQLTTLYAFVEYPPNKNKTRPFAKAASRRGAGI